MYSSNKELAPKAPKFDDVGETDSDDNGLAWAEWLKDNNIKAGDIINDNGTWVKITQAQIDRARLDALDIKERLNITENERSEFSKDVSEVVAPIKEGAKALQIKTRVDAAIGRVSVANETGQLFGAVDYLTRSDKEVEEAERISGLNKKHREKISQYLTDNYSDELVEEYESNPEAFINKYITKKEK